MKKRNLPGKKSPKTFEEPYFEKYYQQIGDFSLKRDLELSNWFRGMFEFIHGLYPIKNGKGKSLIEFGCATGVFANIFKTFGYRVTATDISEYAIRNAKKNYAGIKFRVQDMQTATSLKNKYDVAVAFDVVEHLKHPEKAIKNTFQMLNPGGIMILSTPSDGPNAYGDPTHINVKKASEWKKIMKQTGFQNIIVKETTFVPYLYRFHWRLAIILPFPVNIREICSPTFIIGKKEKKEGIGSHEKTSSL